MTKRKTYTNAFKLEAVKLLEPGESTAGQLARELGVRRNSLYKWQKDLNKIASQLNDRPRETVKYKTPKEAIEATVALTP